MRARDFRPLLAVLIAFGLFSVFALVMATAERAAALQVPPGPAHRVNDFADILTAHERKGLEDALAAHEQATTNQIVIATFSSLEGENLEDFSMRLAEAWKIGQAGKDNGVIISVYMQDRKARIEVGYGLEGALPDVDCRRILDEELTPRFREKNYAGGLQAVVSRIGGELGDTALAAMAPARSTTSAGRGSKRDVPLSQRIIGLVIGIIALVLVMSAIDLVSRLMGRRRGGRSIWTSGGGSHRSSGGYSGGGFSGGGGSFGGGGSSGSW